MRKEVPNTFLRNGFASLEDLKTDEFKKIYNKLDVIQQEVFAANVHLDEYIWPRCPLQDQTRPWEYPYVHSNLRTLLGELPSSPTTILDLGSGFTFFPFALARLGYKVIALDIDGVAGKIYRKAQDKINEAPGSIRFIQGDLTALPLETESVEAIYCISVLEHLETTQNALEDSYRVLKAEGYLILTFDIDLKGNFEMGPRRFKDLLAEIARRFVPLYRESILHPMSLLTNQNHPYVKRKRLIIKDARLREVLSHNKRYLVKLLKGSQKESVLVSSYGLCLRKR